MSHDIKTTNTILYRQCRTLEHQNNLYNLDKQIKLKMSVRYFFDLTRDEESGRYLVNLIICTANIREGHLDALLEALALGSQQQPPSKFLNRRTLNTFYACLICISKKEQLTGQTMPHFE